MGNDKTKVTDEITVERTTGETFNTEGQTFDTDAEPDEDSLINPADVEPDEDIEDPNYDPANDEVDPEQHGHADMEPDPGEDN